MTQLAHRTKRNASVPSGAVYAIAKWETVFERAESRKLKQLTWVAMPVSFTSAGFQSLLDEFGDDAPAIYGCWCALVAVAATCHVRGVLASSRGIPLKLSHIARMTGFPKSDFERLVAWAAMPEVGWLEPIGAAQLALFLEENADFPTGLRVAKASSGESPDDPPATEQDRTGPNKTRPIAAAAKAAVADGIDWLEEIQQAIVRDKKPVVLAAEKLASPALKVLGREYIWHVAAVSECLTPGFCSEVATKIKNGNVTKFKAYIDSAMRAECERRGLDWVVLQKQIPVPPQPASG